jgi:ribosomal protein L29
MSYNTYQQQVPPQILQLQSQLQYLEQQLPSLRNQYAMAQSNPMTQNAVRDQINRVQAEISGITNTLQQYFVQQQQVPFDNFRNVQQPQQFYQQPTQPQFYQQPQYNTNNISPNVGNVFKSYGNTEQVHQQQPEPHGRHGRKKYPEPQHTNRQSAPAPVMVPVYEEPVETVPFPGSEFRPLCSTGLFVDKEIFGIYHKFNIKGTSTMNNTLHVIDLNDPDNEIHISLYSGVMCNNEKMSYFEFQSMEQESTLFTMDAVSFKDIIVPGDTPNDIYINAVIRSSDLVTLSNNIIGTGNVLFIKAVNKILTKRINDALETSGVVVNIDSYVEDITALFEFIAGIEEVSARNKVTEIMNDFYRTLGKDVDVEMSELTPIYTGDNFKSVKIFEKITILYIGDDQLADNIDTEFLSTGSHEPRSVTKDSHTSLHKALTDICNDKTKNASLSGKINIIVNTELVRGEYIAQQRGTDFVIKQD